MEGFEKPRLKGLLDHFAVMEDTRESWRSRASVAGDFVVGRVRDDYLVRRF